MKNNKRTLKNIVMIAVGVLMIAALVFSTGIIRPGGGDMPENFQGQPPQMQSEEGQEPPELPEGAEMPDFENGEKPEFDEGQEPPELPEGMDESDMKNFQPGEKLDGMPGGMGVTRIVLTGAEALILSIIIIYLIMSGFNRKTFRETLPDAKKKIVYIIVTLVLGAVIVAAASFVPMKMMSSMGGPGQMPPGQSQEITELPDEDGTQDEDSNGTEQL